MPVPAPAPPSTPSVLVTAGRVDVGAEIAALDASLGGAAGGLVTFSGYCRDEGGRLAALEIEHYPGMAERELAKVAEEAANRWPLLGCRAVHRHGLILPGQEIVLVACAAVHREPAFEAAAFLMDFLKTRAPFWKREHLADGTIGDWVEARRTDDAAAARWAAGAAA